MVSAGFSLSLCSSLQGNVENGGKKRFGSWLVVSISIFHGLKSDSREGYYLSRKEIIKYTLGL